MKECQLTWVLRPRWVSRIAGRTEWRRGAGPVVRSHVWTLESETIHLGFCGQEELAIRTHHRWGREHTAGSRRVHRCEGIT